MRLFAVVLALGITTPAAAFQQAPAEPAPVQPAPAQPAPAPAGNVQAPAPESQTPAAAPQPVPFQDGFKYAYIDIQAIASQSKPGQEATARIEALRDKLAKEISAQQKTAQDLDKQLQSQGSLLSDAKRLELQTELERRSRDIQRMAEDADEEIGRLQARLQEEFMARLRPVIDRVARDKQVHMVFNAVDSGLVWAVPGMNLTVDVITAFNSAPAPAPAAAGAAPPTAPPTASPAAPQTAPPAAAVPPGR